MSAPTATRYQLTELGTGRTATGTMVEIHDQLTGWLAAGLDTLEMLAAVDQLVDAVERGSHDRVRLEVQLGVDVDELVGAAS